MSKRLKVLGTVLRKDLRLFWLLAVLTALLNFMDSLNAILRRDGWIDELMVAATLLATSLFILLLFHEDSAVTGKRDWLTRPVPGTTMLAAKCILVALAFLLPEVLGMILNALHLGRPPAEAFVSSIADGFSGAALLVFLCLIVFAALTSGMRQAIVAFLVLTVVLVVGFVYLSGGLLRFPPAYWFFDSIGTASGTDWMVKRTLQLLLAFTALAVLWILYGRRHGRRAALVVIGVAVLAGGVLLATTSRSAMFGLQKRLSPDQVAASSVAVSLLPGCFPTRTLDAAGKPAASGAAEIPDDSIFFMARMRGNTNAIAFAVRLVVDRIPEGAQLVVSRSLLTYSTADGGTVSLGAGRASTSSAQQWVKTQSGQRAIDQYWLISRNDYQRLWADPGTTAHFEYSLSLLNPTATAVFAADGQRAFRPGIGYCGAATNRYREGANVECYRTGDQPALLAVRLDGQSDIEDRPSLLPDFTPALLDFWGGSRHRMFVADAGASPVRVTAYEARAHFTRQFDVPGVLGGPVSSCPIP